MKLLGELIRNLKIRHPVKGSGHILLFSFYDLLNKLLVTMIAKLDLKLLGVDYAK
jgi:hypothetical protein